mmetsp:Transcript_6145/g.7031  ORF Transcript_6145/g.7031 Transcript_6145/m.7031 type:complete len:207 (+) Transcript_6145:244-864(+)
MKVQKLPLVALAAVTVVGSVFAHDCSCHVCPSGSYGIDSAPTPFAVVGSNSASGGMVDGETWTLEDVVWLEAGALIGTPAEFGAAFYSQSEDLSSGFEAGFTPFLSPVSINVTGTVLADIRAGCFCVSGGMNTFTGGAQSMGGLSRTWMTGATTAASCGAGTAQSDFSIIYDSLSADSFGNSGGGSVNTGFSRSGGGGGAVFFFLI